MNKLVLLGVVVMLACQADNRNLERKVDDINKKLDDLSNRIARGGAGAAPQRPPRVEPDRAKTYAVPIENDAVDGPADAKVTLIKAYDYLCPFCERVRPTMKDLRKKYGNDLRIVYKHLVVHPPAATVGALAACAADKQGKFHDMDNLLWDKGFKGRELNKDGAAQGGQQCWTTDAGCPSVVAYAQEIGLDVGKFKADMKDECKKAVDKDMSDLRPLGVGATPTFFVNGRYLVGAMPMDSFVALIDEELKKANERIAAGVPAASYYQQEVLGKGLRQLERPAR